MKEHGSNTKRLKHSSGLMTIGNSMTVYVVIVNRGNGHLANRKQYVSIYGNREIKGNEHLSNKKRADHIWQVRNSMAVYMAIANRGNRHMQIKKKRGSGHMASKKQHGSI